MKKNKMKSGKLRRISLLAIVLAAGFFTVYAFVAKKKLNASEMLEWFGKTENGMTYQQTGESIRLEIMYQPYIYRKALCVNKGNMKDVSDDHCFRVKFVSLQGEDILKAGGADEELYQARLNYLLTDLQTNAAIVDGKDTVYCSHALYVPNYGLTPYADVLLSFEKKSGETNDLQFVLNDPFFGFGFQEMNISKEKIESIPLMIE